MVFAETRDGIIKALRRGHVYITDSPDGPHLEIAIGEAPMGGIAASSTGVELFIAAKGAAGDELRLVAQTGVLTRLTIPTDEWQHTIPLPSQSIFADKKPMRQQFEGRLSVAQMASHVGHEFEVPEGTGTLRLRFEHDPRHPGVGDIPHQLSISVYGPNGPRGTRHNNADQSPVISTGFASPGYLAGPIEPGTWRVEIDVHRLLPPGDVSYTIDVMTDEGEAIAEKTITPQSGQKKRGPGWYKGDLHGHTIHSDADLEVSDYLELALSRGFDFVALTDHNTVSGIRELEARAGNAITIIGGTELTTFHGHALVLSTRDLVDWRIRDKETMSARAAEVARDGKLFIIAHPKAEGHPFCTGCRWAYSDMLPGPARHVEIWNREWRPCAGNEQAIGVFYRWLNEGYRMVATAGTDTHRPSPESARLAANYVYAEDNTEAALLAAISSGRSFVSSGPFVSFSATTHDGLSAQMGEVADQGTLCLEMSWRAETPASDLTGLTARLICRGEIIETWDCAETSEAQSSLGAKNGDWFTLELRDHRGALYALTNPIFVGVPERE
ncbi:phosphoesterase [Devosia pacifica]|uniref:Phosphoesterase n=1 Tax=Devosia pacifica TaxID=1335967 RepID=A0A918S845_9HYPH|nr:CehA/McbA family metallohydrolase [Devosia pacifica]GHA25641.1 phosphoesterase [Devosia pacifica]